MPDTLNPGPEMDAAVAAAVGWTVRFTGHGVDRRIGGDDSPVWVPFSPSVEVADAIAALEATSRDWNIRVDRVCYVGIETVTAAPGGECDPDYWAGFSAGDTLPEASCRAILAWAKAKPHLPASSRMRLRAGKDGHA